MSRYGRFCFALMLPSASTALSQDVRYNFDKTADFSKFKTYVWVTIKNGCNGSTWLESPALNQRRQSFRAPGSVKLKRSKSAGW